MSKIVVVGAGYVGLVTAVCFAAKGNNVVVVEKDGRKVKLLEKRNIPFYESGLDILLQEALDNKKLVFTSSLADALSMQPEIIFSCVGTPSKPDGSADLSAVFMVAREIGFFLSHYSIIVNKSTVPVGTAKKVESIIKEQLELRGVPVKFDVASNPEFLKEGSAVKDFLFPNRVVIGTSSVQAIEILQKLYSPFIKNAKHLLIMSRESAELTKYAANSFLAMKISFINKIALLADKVGADIEQVKKGISLDERVGQHFLNAGIGYGGSCFPKDVKALIKLGEEFHEEMTLFEEVENINLYLRRWFVRKILSSYDDLVLGKRIGIWGAAFKPGTDDIRSAPSLDIIAQLLNKGAGIIVYDPLASSNVKKIFGDKVIIADSAVDVLAMADALVLLTEWEEFLNFEPNDFTTLKDRVFFDGRNCFDPFKMMKVGIRYFSVGRNNLPKSLARKFLRSLKSKYVLGQKIL